jgi:hypothetical protein
LESEPVRRRLVPLLGSLVVAITLLAGIFHGTGGVLGMFAAGILIYAVSDLIPMSNGLAA